MQLTKNFHLIEYRCKDGTLVPEKFKANALENAKNLQIIRDYASEQEGREIPIVINSGFRTLDYNRKVGGAKNSQHLLAKASDIHSPELNIRQLYKYICELIEDGKIHNGGLHLYNNFIHYDVRKSPVRW